MPLYEIAAARPNGEHFASYARRFTNLDAAGEQACGLALFDAAGRDGAHLVRNDQRTGPDDIETWCADDFTSPVWAVRLAHGEARS